jgi:phenylacetaldehyde dehydrogenase
MKVVREEIFGPVLCAIPCASEDDDVINSGNDTSFGLASGIWTRDLNKAHRTARRLRAGTVWINCYSVLDAATPFGRYKESGWGREMGHTRLRTTSKPSPWSPSSHCGAPCNRRGPRYAERPRHHPPREKAL